MSYENALSTQLLALYCCCCSRPLRDPESIQIGIGPICREKYGWGADVSPAAKKAANVLTEEAAKPSTSNDRRLEIALEITELGFTVLGRRIAETFLRDSSKEAQAKVSKLFISEVTVKISLDALYDANVPDSKMLVNAPYVKGVTQVFNADIKAAAVVKAEWSRGSGAQGRDIFLGWGTTARYRAAIWPVIVKHFAGGTLEVYRNHILVSSAVIPLSAREDVESVDEVPADLRAAPGEAAPVKPAAIKEIRFEAGLFIIEAPYDSNLVAAVKALPYQDRKWDGARKVWTVTLPAFGAARTGRILQMSEIAARFNLKADCLADLDKTAFAMETARLAAVARDSAAARTEGDERMMNAAPLVGRRTFQLEGIRFLAGSPEGILPNVRLLADDMGLGKTWQVLLALSTSEGAVVVVPASVKYNWAKELAHLRPDLRCEVLEGKNSWRWPADGEVIFLNYDILPERFGPKGGTKKKPAEPVLNAEDHNRGRRTTLVVDEAQGVRNPEALRTTRIKTLRALCKRTWFLTGTPIENRTKDLWYMIAALGVEKQVFGSFEEYMGLVGAYKETIRVRGGFTRTIIVWPPTGENVSPRLPEILRSKIMLRRRKDDVAKDLPGKQYKYVEIKLPSMVAKAADKAWEKWCQSAGTRAPKTLPDFEEFSEVRAQLASARIEAALEIAESYEDAGEPLVVYSAHLAPLKALAEREGWALIDGSVDQKERQRRVDAFQAGELKGLAVSIRAGNAGITLTRASHMLFIDREWNPKTNRQAEDRIHRIGQEAESLLYTILTSDHPLDRHVDSLLEGKENAIDAAIDGFGPARSAAK